MTTARLPHEAACPLRASRGPALALLVTPPDVLAGASPHSWMETDHSNAGSPLQAGTEACCTHSLPPDNASRFTGGEAEAQRIGAFCQVQAGNWPQGLWVSGPPRLPLQHRAPLASCPSPGVLFPPCPQPPTCWPKAAAAPSQSPRLICGMALANRFVTYCSQIDRKSVV